MKKTHVLWSGGLDSTYLVQLLLSKGATVYASYVRLENNEAKTKMEMAAIQKMVPIFKQRYAGFIHHDKEATMVFSSEYSLPDLHQVLPWLTAAQMIIHPDAEELAIGYVMNDCAISYLPEIRGIWKAMCCLSSSRKKPTIVFPLIKETKLSIYHQLLPELRGLTVTCEQPKTMDDGSWSPCGVCVPCQRHPGPRKVLDSLAVIESDPD